MKMEAFERLMALEQTLTFTIAMIIYVAIPGSAVMAIVARALSDGFLASTPHILGNVIGNLIYFLASIYGLLWIAEQMGEAFLIIKLAGGAYLIYLGVKLWRSSGEISAANKHQRKNLLACFFTGLMITLSNPKAILFYLAILPAIMDLRTVSLGELMPIMLINALVVMTVIGSYSAIAAKVRQFFTNTKAMRKLNKGAGGIMIGAGLGIAAS